MATNIQEKLEKFKSVSGGSPDLFLAALLVLVAVTSFLLGRMSTEGERQVVRQDAALIPEAAEETKASSDASESVTEAKAPGGYVASKNGTKYHLPWCSGAQLMNEENKIWFATKAEAEAAGYEPAANCKGL